jgi:hypothetical protein
MTPQEWAAFAAELRHSFVGDFGPTGPHDTDGAAQEAVYRRHFGGLDYDVTSAAVALLVNDGRVHLPRPGELRAAVRRVTEASSLPFAEVWEILTDAAMRHRGASADVVAIVSRECGEGAARWVAARGVGDLMHEPVNGEHGGAVRHRLEAEFASFVAQAEEDGRVGRAIEQAQRQQIGRGRGLRQIEARP